jgi:hypothetical protein
VGEAEIERQALARHLGRSGSGAHPRAQSSTARKRIITLLLLGRARMHTAVM